MAPETKRGLVDQDLQPTSRLEERLGDRFDLTIGIDPPTEDAMIEALEGFDVLFPTSRVPVTERVLRGSDLELVAKIGTGLDNIDLEAARELGIPVTNTAGGNAIAVAEHTLGMIIAVAHKIVHTHERLQAGQWRSDLDVGSLVYGKTVGIIGFGDIGSRVAHLLEPFHADVYTYDPYVHEIETEYSGATMVDDLDDLLSRADFVTVNAELTDETRGLIGERELSVMKDSAVLVNTARGPIVSQDALVEALRAGDLAGAGLDVFEEEPAKPDNPLFEFDNVVTTPHFSAQTWEIRVRTIDMLAENAIAIVDGRAGDVPDRFLAVPP